MIFHEIYSVYYNTVAKIIAAAIDDGIDDAAIAAIVTENAFEESVLTILPALNSEKWQLLRQDRTTPLQHLPTLPLTTVQKQWLKAISLDPRIRLFDVDFSGLADIEPLFTAEDYYVYDKYSDGDPFEDEAYVRHFRTILSAIKNGQNIKIEMQRRRSGTIMYARCRPERLEYSEKDDRFRLVTSGCPFVKTINLDRITKCKIYHGDAVIDTPPPPPTHEWVTLKVQEERNTLERCLMHFAHFEKRAERIDDHYLLHVKFDHDDEPEMVIRVLSFGPTVEVLEPESFRNRIISKLKSQKSCEFG